MTMVDYPDCLRELLESDTRCSLDDIVAELSNPLPSPNF